MMPENMDIHFPDRTIAYKIHLGSPKDIEDALFLFEIFRGYLDAAQLREQMKAFHVSGDNYGIIL